MKKSKSSLLIVLLVILVVVASAFIFRNKDVDNTIDENIIEVENVIEDNTSGEDVLSGGSYNEELNLEVEGFEDSNPEMISGASYENEPIVIGNSQVTGKPVYYSQRDSRWKNILYTSVGDSSQTIGSSGCGPTSAAMIIAGIKDSSVTPVQIADLFVKNGFRTSNNGTYCSAFKWIANRYSIEFKQVYNVDTAIQEVRNGNFLVVSCSNGLFTTGGHYIVIAGIDGDTLKIYDPYLYSGKFDISSRKGKVTVSGTTVYCSVSNFKNYANSKGWFVFIPDKSTQKYSQGQTVLVNEKIGIAYDGGSSMIVDNGLNQFWINSSVVTNDSRIYGLATVVWDEGERVLVQLFDSQFWVHSSSLSSEIPSSDNKTTEPKIEVKTETKVETKVETKTETKVETKYVLGKYKTNTALNVRKGPGTNYKIVKTYTKNTRFDTKEIKGVWARTPSGWVNLNYCTLVNKY